MCFNSGLQCSLTAVLVAFKVNDCILQKLNLFCIFLNLVLLSLSWCERFGLFWMLLLKVAEGSNDRMSFEV